MTAQTTERSEVSRETLDHESESPVVPAVRSGEAHTPGPWRTIPLAGRFDSRVQAYRIAYGPSGNYVAIVEACGNESLNNPANACLIAAAPYMLTALKTAEQMVAYGRYDEAEEVLGRAIAKAEGRTMTEPAQSQPSREAVSR